MIDTHAHLYLEQFNKDIDDVISRAAQENIEKIFLPNIDSTTTESMIALADKFPERCFPMIGLHPCSVKQNYKDELQHITDMLAKYNFSGIGETGIDLYWDKTFRSEQIESFEWQIEIAKETGLPVIIHSRESLDLTIEIVSAHQGDNLTGVFHCFNGDVSQCRKIADMNFMMGLGGVVTYKNAGLEDMVNYMPRDHYVLETDAPYLAPVPKRGKRNETCFIRHIAEKVAEFKNRALEEVIQQTDVNAGILFRYDA